MRSGLVLGMEPAVQPPAPARTPLLPWPARLLADPVHTSSTVFYLVLAAALGGAAVALAGLDALFIGVALLACVFIALDFRIGVVLLILMMPISASALFPHAIAGVTGLNPLNLLLVGTLGSCLVHRALAPPASPLVPAPLIWRYVLPIVLAGLLGSRSVGAIPAYFQAAELINFSSAGSYLRDMLIKPLFMVLFAVLIGAALVRSRQPERFLWPMLVSIWLMGLLTIVFVFISGASLSQLASSEAREFFSPLGMHANDLGRCYAIAYALLLFIFTRCPDPRLRLILLATMAMVVVALIMTFSRGAFLGFAVVNVLFLITRRHIVALVGGIMMLAGLVLMLPDAVFLRLAAGWHGGLNAISAGRIDHLWLPLLPEVWSNPLFGNGLGAMMWSPAMRGGGVLQVTHPHNAFLRTVLDMGFIGLVLILAYFTHVWRSMRRLARDPAVSPLCQGLYEGAAVGLLAFLATATVGSSLTPVAEQNFLWFAIGMMYGEQARLRETAHG